MEICLNAQSGRATLTNKVENNYPAKPSGALNIYGIDGNSSMAPTPVTFYNSGIETGSTGTGQAFSIMQPSLAINYIMCLTGAFPSRN